MYTCKYPSMQFDKNIHFTIGINCEKLESFECFIKNHEDAIYTILKRPSAMNDNIT